MGRLDFNLRLGLRKIVFGNFFFFSTKVKVGATPGEPAVAIL